MAVGAGIWGRLVSEEEWSVVGGVGMETEEDRGVGRLEGILYGSRRDVMVWKRDQENG